MVADRQRLVEEIERLEKELESQHFRGLFDQKVQHKQEKKLKKLRRELAEIDGTSVVQEPFRKQEATPEPKAPRQPKTVKIKPAKEAPAARPRASVSAKTLAKTPAKAARTPAKRATRPAAKPKSPAVKEKSATKTSAKPKPRKKSK